LSVVYVYVLSVFEGGGGGVAWRGGEKGLVVVLVVGAAWYNGRKRKPMAFISPP
jgi:hypothetical protein